MVAHVAFAHHSQVWKAVPGLVVPLIGSMYVARDGVSPNLHRGFRAAVATTIVNIKATFKILLSLLRHLPWFYIPVGNSRSVPHRSCRSLYQIPGNMTNRLFLYLSPNSFLYFRSLRFAQI